MGIVSRTVTYAKPVLTHVVVALSQAVIDKTYLTWLDVNKLLTAFPQLVKLVGDAVIFQGPVVIVSPMSLASHHFIKCSIAIIAGVVSCFVTGVLYGKISRAYGATTFSINRRIVVSLIVGLANGALHYYMAGRYLPTHAGVYFVNQPPFYV